VDTGYWPLYRWNPSLLAEGKNPFVLDSKQIRTNLSEILKTENRFASLARSDPETAAKLHEELDKHVHERHAQFVRRAMSEQEMRKYLSGSQGREGGESWLILYGTETGNAEEVARRLYNEARWRGMNVTLTNMADYVVEDLPKETNVTIVCSTCGQGEFPKGAVDFWKHLSDPHLPVNWLEHTNYNVFGLGDSNYCDHFCEAAKSIDKRMAELGGKRMQDVGIGDDQHVDGFEGGLDSWIPDLWKLFGNPQPSQSLPPSSNLVEVFKNGEIQAPPRRHVSRPGSHFAKVMVKRKLTPADYDRVTWHLELDIHDTSMKYNIGDTLAIYPHNTDLAIGRKGGVAEMLEHFGVEEDTVLKVIPSDKKNRKFPEILTAGALFRELLDLFGKPSRRFYAFLAALATDAKEKEKLEFLLSEEGRSEYRRRQEDTVTYADLLLEFRSAQVPLNHLIDAVPLIKPRYYSIASSQDLHRDAVHLCIVRVDWETSKGVERHGLCTSYVSAMDIGKDPIISCSVKPAAILPPSDPSQPIVMAALGTGLAPFRAFLQQREVLKSQGVSLGTSVLYFGARYEKSEFLYQDEFRKWVSDGTLTHLRTAFSRDQAKKVYIQNKIDEEPELIYDLLVRRNGIFYLCGPSRNVPEDIRNAFIRAIMKCGNKTLEEASQMQKDMVAEGRYNVEAWS
jgi:sulfite reductase alpha subunit-like flavoprotein